MLDLKQEENAMSSSRENGIALFKKYCRAKSGHIIRTVIVLWSDELNI